MSRIETEREVEIDKTKLQDHWEKHFLDCSFRQWLFLITVFGDELKFCC